ncbi:hypothetical protein PpBr36_07293 [Pyricularia pennisetigena]|uniref:hypothetical protein n=1 Tax=Pyricularia pennisetigena TaxID=1578925 RepID=UPI0011517670|nr:hypothetical protein PpBr36_07293 [Pyricularia pennisetigena]TLS25041.1 hypothetical protein PpBr36_07293 [Pyricularia pennisetigena]
MLPSFISNLLGVAQIPLLNQQHQSGYGETITRGRHDWLQVVSKEELTAEPLKFNKDGTFHISIFGDLHFGENAWDQWGPQQDIHSVKVIQKVLDSDRPDLVILNGDLITGDNAFFENATAYVDQIVGPMVDRRLRWASTYGNHDHQYNLSGSAILAHERRYPGSLTTSMVSDPEAGTSNYYLPVYGADCRPPRRGGENHCRPEMILWFFDSRGGWRYQEKDEQGGLVGLENWVHESAVEWFRATENHLRARFGGKAIPSLVFTHIPIYAAHALQTERGRQSVDPRLQPGINDDYPVSPQAQGWCPDGRDNAGCAYGGQDVPFMRAVVETPGVVAMFFGHDHGDTWCHRWDRLVPGMTVEGNGVDLCFGQHSGYGGYGNWIRGARQVFVTEEMLRRREVETWIRLETGHVVGSVVLNATYGEDVYPVTPNDMTYCPTCEYDTGGEANVIEVCVAVQKMLSRYGAPENVINPSFGTTETCAGCIFNSSCPTYDVGQGLEFASLRRPMPGLSARVTAIDTDHANGNSHMATASVRAADPGERCHLEVTGPAAFKGYFGNPEATKTAFTGNGWFRTGDLAYLDEAGNLHLKGRTKELININGVKYLPHELDSALDQAEIPGATPAHFCCFSTRDPGMDTEAVVVLYQPCNHPDFVDDEGAALFDTQKRIGEVIALRTRSRPRVVGLDAGLMQKSTLAKLLRAKLQAAFERGEFAVQRSRHEAAVRRHRLRMCGEPADDREEALLELIREQLELRPEDDFAVNDSILSLGLAARIQTLAAKADKKGSSTSSYDPVVVLQPRGSKPPLWMVHPGVGEVLVFVALARHLTDRPLYAFRARGFEPGENPFGSLEELVRVYHDAVKARQPRGPYAIAGYSFGGMAAFEVAKVLEAGGDEVRVCAPFNLPPHIKWRMRELVWDECVMHLFYFVELISEEGIYAHKEAICQRAYSDHPDGKLEAIRYIKPHCDQTRWKDLGLSEKDYLHWVNIASSMQALAVDYEPSGSVQNIDLFVADPLNHVAKIRGDWINERLSARKDFVKGGDVRFHNVNGAHYTMLNPRVVNVSSFADKLRRVLAERGM